MDLDEPLGKYFLVQKDEMNRQQFITITGIIDEDMTNFTDSSIIFSETWL